MTVDTDRGLVLALTKTIISSVTGRVAISSSYPRPPPLFHRGRPQGPSIMKVVVTGDSDKSQLLKDG